MNTKKRKKWLVSAVGALFILCCAAILFSIFYGVMAYQLADSGAQQVRPDAEGEQALLALPDAQLLAEQTQTQRMGGENCTVTIRTYRTADGLEIEAVSAVPAAYAERLAQEKWTAQLTTGFVLAGMDAVYSIHAEEGMLSARSGGRIYMLRAAADEQTLYALGAQAVLQ